VQHLLIGSRGDAKGQQLGAVSMRLRVCDFQVHPLVAGLTGSLAGTGRAHRVNTVRRHGDACEMQLCAQRAL
jgi:hypothetical protein